MTDREIIQGLIDRNDRVTREFFFKHCRPLFNYIISLVFTYEVEYDEFVNELYLNLMDNDGAKLRSFDYRGSVYQWLKVVAIRFFINKRGRMIEDQSHESHNYERGAAIDADNSSESDIQRLLQLMPNKRYAHVIQRLILDDIKPEELASSMKITTANLYNIRRRAMAQLTRVALMDIHYYGK